MVSVAWTTPGQVDVQFLCVSVFAIYCGICEVDFVSV